MSDPQSDDRGLLHGPVARNWHCQVLQFYVLRNVAAMTCSHGKRGVLSVFLSGNNFPAVENLLEVTSLELE